MALAELSATLASSPLWFPQVFDAAANRLLFVRRTEDDYRAISFLDQRSMQPGEERYVVAWDEVAAAVQGDTRADVQYIFHIGHVGSTLISRLLGEAPGILSLREPLFLRTLAQLPVPRLRASLPLTTALLSRTFRPEQRALIKATSFTSEIGPGLVPAGSRALLLYATPRHYIEGILAGAASQQELVVLASDRARRLAARCELSLPPPGPAGLAAQAWACEMTSLEAAACALGSARVLWIDFDQLLNEPASSLVHIAAFFGHALDDACAASICEGPLMCRYSKAPEFEYSPQLRLELLREASAEHRTQIDAALAWLDREAVRCPLLASGLDRAR